MESRIFLRDVGGYRAKQIVEHPSWPDLAQSLERFHGADLAAVSMPLEEAAVRYVEGLQTNRETHEPAARGESRRQR